MAYLRYKRDADPHDLHRRQIDAALDAYWLDRAQHAPTTASLKQHLTEEADYLAAISSGFDKSAGG